jgi:hypothetical protein
VDADGTAHDANSRATLAAAWPLIDEIVELVADAARRFLPASEPDSRARVGVDDSFAPTATSSRGSTGADARRGG